MADLGIGLEKAEQPQVSDNGGTYRRINFLFEDSPGNKLDKRLRSKDELPKSEEVQLSDVIQARLQRQLYQHMDNLANLYKKNPRLLDAPGHQEDRQAWLLMGDEDEDARREKIDIFLQSTNGIKFIDALLQQSGSQKLQVVGLYASTNRPGERDGTVDPVVYRTEEDQGAINRVWHSTIRPKLGEVGPKEHLGRFEAVAGTLAGAAMAGADIGGRTYGPKGLLMGGGAGLAAGLAALVGGYEWGRLARSGKTLELKRSVDALAALQTDPQEIEYYKTMYNIDISKFTVDVATQRIRVNGDSQYVERLRDEGVQALELRKDLYEELGVPRERLDSTPELNLLDSLGGFEQSASRVGQDIIDAYYEGGYDPATHTLAQNQLRMARARSKAMVSYAKEEITKNNDSKEREASIKGRPVGTLNIRIQEYEGDSQEVVNRRMKAEYKRKELLKKERDKRQLELDRFVDVEGAKTTLRGIADKLSQPPYGLTIGPGLDSSRVNIEVSAKVTKLNNSLRDSSVSPATGLKVDLELKRSEYNESRSKRWTELIGEARGKLGTKDVLSSKIIESLKEEADEYAAIQHGAEIERLTKDIAEVEQKIAELIKSEAAFRDTSKELAKKQAEILANVPRELVATRASYDLFRAGGTITDILLESQTVDQLIILAVVPPYSLPNGTPDEQAALRKKIIQAKSELKGRHEEIVNPSPREQRLALTEIALRGGLPITIDDLLGNKSDTELIRILTMDTAYAGWRSGLARRSTDIRAELANAKVLAAKMQLDRYKADLVEGIADDDRQIESIDERAKNLRPVLDAEKARIQLSLDIIARQEKLFTTSQDIIHDQKVTDRFTNLARYSSSDASILSQSERELVDSGNVPKGYFEFMDLFFQYRDRSDRDRNEYFREILASLPPDKLAGLLNEGLELGLRRNINMRSVLARMSTNIQDGKLEASTLRRTFRAITDRLQAEALALS